MALFSPAATQQGSGEEHRGHTVGTRGWRIAAGLQATLGIAAPLPPWLHRHGACSIARVVCFSSFATHDATRMRWAALLVGAPKCPKYQRHTGTFPECTALKQPPYFSPTQHNTRNLSPCVAQSVATEGTKRPLILRQGASRPQTQSLLLPSPPVFKKLRRRIPTWPLPPFA